jgi:peptide/nickel transport system ATP-binding protein
MLRVSNLSVGFSRYGHSNQKPQAICSVDLDVSMGEIMAVVGESGSGKSLLALAILGLLPTNARMGGEIAFQGQTLDQKNINILRGREIALIPQSVAYLNPFKTVRSQVLRAACLSGLQRSEATLASDAALARYGLDPAAQRRYPHQISGGMARRALTATATTGNASLIVADEPTTGLDHATAGESLRHLRELADSDKAVLLITHDIVAALSVADRVAVFLGGMVLEVALASDFNNGSRLRHPYTQALWQALPCNAFMNAPARSHTGSSTGHGCVYAGDCHLSDHVCRNTLPEWKDVAGGRVRCHHA